MAAREVAPEPGVFFVSYARHDRGPYFDKFIKDIEREVAQQTGWPDVAFVDTDDIPLGADWRDEIAEALRKCPVLLCVYSPSFFRSRHCGGEFGVFLQRQAGMEGFRWEGNEIRGSRYIVPVLWRRLAQLEAWNFPPPWLGGIQHASGGHGTRVEEEGLRGLIRTDPATAEEVIEGIAEMIVRLLVDEEGVLAEYPERPTVAELADVFEREPLALFSVEGDGAAAHPRVEESLETATAGDLVVVGLYDSEVAGSTWPWHVGLPDGERVDVFLVGLAQDHRFGLRVRALDAASDAGELLPEILAYASTRGLQVVLAAEPLAMGGDRVPGLLNRAVGRADWSGLVVVHGAGAVESWQPGWHDPSLVNVLRVAESGRELETGMRAALTRLRTHVMAPGSAARAEPVDERPPRLVVPGALRG